MEYCTLCGTPYDSASVINLTKVFNSDSVHVGYRCPRIHCNGLILDIDEMMIPIIEHLYHRFGIISLFSCSGHWYNEYSFPYLMIMDDENNDFCAYIHTHYMDLANENIKPNTFGIELEYSEPELSYIGNDGEEYFVKRSITFCLPGCTPEQFIAFGEEARIKHWEIILQAHQKFFEFITTLQSQYESQRFRIDEEY